MSKITRRQMIQATLMGAATLAAHPSGLAQEPVTQAGAEVGSRSPAIIPPTGIAIDKPRLQGIRRVIVDTDPGNDDALALLMALLNPNLIVEAVTVCPGNMGMEGYNQQVRNALYVVDLAGKGGKVPVHRGMANPILSRPYPVATFIHGKYGLGEVEVSEVAQKTDPEHAVDAMRRIVNQSPGEITILALGGLTNVAMAMLRDEAFTRNLRGVLFVGGKYAQPGMAASYNVAVDPEAADIVVRSGIQLTMTGDASRRDSILVEADYQRAAALNTKLSKFFIASNVLRRTYEMKYRGAAGSINADPLAVAMAADPTVGEKYMSVNMKVELDGQFTRGQLVYGEDIYSGHIIPPGNVDVCIAANSDKFKAQVFETLKAF
jgi:inosine-uridine nucleoside N-ribohydrolase